MVQKPKALFYRDVGVIQPDESSLFNHIPDKWATSSLHQENGTDGGLMALFLKTIYVVFPFILSPVWGFLICKDSESNVHSSLKSQTVLKTQFYLYIFNIIYF